MDTALAWILPRLVLFGLVGWAMIKLLVALVGVHPVIRERIQSGFLIGFIAGAINGPIAMWNYMAYASAKWGAVFLGLELLGAPFLGALVLALVGIILGALNGQAAIRRGRNGG